MRSRSYVVAILRILAASQGKPMTPSELHELLRGQPGFGLLGGLKGPRPIDSIAMTLDELREVGVVVSTDGRWSIQRPSDDDTAEDARSGAARGGAGDTGQPPIPPAGPSGEGQDGSGGIGEVLLHPILFSIDEDAFDAAIERAIAQF